MDNASKALIMAGGILIAVLIIGLAIYILASARGFASASNDQAELSAIESFNRYYLSFDSTIQGIDAVNLYNKAKDDSNRVNHIHEVSTSEVNEDIKSLAEGLANGSKDVAGSYEMLKKNYNYKYSFDSDGYVNSIEIKK